MSDPWPSRNCQPCARSKVSTMSPSGHPWNTRSLTLAASMRRPPRVQHNLLPAREPASRRPTGGAAASNRLPHLPEKGFSGALPLPSPIRPASIRTLGGASWLRCQLGSSIFSGCCHLIAELNASVSRSARSAASTQSPGLGDGRIHRPTLGRPRELRVAQRLVDLPAGP